MGYDVEVVRYDKWRANKDYFGLWDLICVSDALVRFVQVKTNNKPDKKWVDKALEWGPDSPLVIKEYVVYKDYQRGDKPWKAVTLE